MGKIGIGIGVSRYLHKSAGIQWSSYWAPQSAVVENAAPTQIVLTYPKKVRAADIVTTNFAVSGKTINNAAIDTSGKIVTLTVTAAFVYGDSITLVANSTNIAVTNNVAKEAELVTFQTGLTAPLASDEEILLNNFVRTIKIGLGSESLSEDFDVMYLSISGRSSETPLRNLVKRIHDGTAVGGLTHTPLEGVKGNGVTQHINMNWNGRTAGHASSYTLNSASFGIYFNTSTDGTDTERHGTYSTTADGGTANRTMIVRPNMAAPNNFFHVAVNSGIESAESDEKISGMYIASRTAAAVQKLWVNKVLKINGTASATKIPNQDMMLLAIKADDGKIRYRENDQISFAFLGRGFDETEIGIITDAYQTYKTAVDLINLNNAARFSMTFDGGRSSQYTQVFPLLVSKGISATFYIQTDVIGTADHMTWAQVKEMHDAGMDMQCHSKTHTDFTTLTQEQISAELQAVNAAFIANNITPPVHHAYPSSAYNDNVRTWVAVLRQTAAKINGIPPYAAMSSSAAKTIIDRMGIQNWNVTTEGGIAAIKAKIDAAKVAARGSKCIVSYTHGIDASDIEQTSLAALTEIIDYIIENDVVPSTIYEIGLLLDKVIVA